MTIEIFDKDELAKYLNVDIKTVRYLLYQDKIPKVKIGREYRFLRRDIDDWLISRREKPQRIGIPNG